MAVLKLFACVLLMVVATNANYSVYQTIEKIKADGFEAESHKVTTSDGYILEMHRIPHGRTNKDTTEDRPVVLAMHGFMSASQAFVMLGPEKSVAYNLADAGFDVWMGNARGTKSSRAHVSLNPDDAVQKYEFFDFSWEEIGMLDLPAMIDYILKTTGKDQLHYIGHSQGGTVLLVMASMLPEYNKKIASAHLLAGVGYQDYFPDEQLTQSASMTDVIYYTALQAGAVELFPPNSLQMLPDDIFQWPAYCLGNKNMQYMCQIFGISRITVLSQRSPDHQIMIGTEAVERVHKFTYLGSVVSETGGSEEDIASRIAKARATFAQLRQVWQSRKLTRRIKLKIFGSNVKSVLLYGCETWKVTKDISRQIQVFVNRCLRRILGIYWPETISNLDLLEKCHESPIDRQIKRRKWGWIGHTLRRGPDHIPKQALEWNPQGKRKRGRPRQTWRRTVVAEAAGIGMTWSEVKREAQDRSKWRTSVDALCPI